MLLTWVEKNHIHQLNALRQSILELGDKFAAAQGWASERVFSKWVDQQDWRQCLPPIFEFEVERVTSPSFIDIRFVGSLFPPHLNKEFCKPPLLLELNESGVRKKSHVPPLLVNNGRCNSDIEHGGIQGKCSSAFADGSCTLGHLLSPRSGCVILQFQSWRFVLQHVDRNA